MQPARHKPAPRPDDLEVNSLSPAWIGAGLLLFVGALATPLTVLKYVPVDGAGRAPLMVEAEQAQQALASAEGEQVRTVLAQGPIVPGEGIAAVRLGASAKAMIAVLPDPLFKGIEAAGLSSTEHRGYQMGQTLLTLQTDPDLDRIDSVRLAVEDCQALLYYQPRQEGVPSTAGGLSLGSHASRVTGQLGAPTDMREGISPTGHMRPTVEHVYPGMTLEFCKENRLVSSIEIAPAPDGLPLAEPLIASAVPALIGVEPADATPRVAGASTARAALVHSAPDSLPDQGRALALSPPSESRAAPDHDRPVSADPTPLTAGQDVDLAGLALSPAAIRSAGVTARAPQGLADPSSGTPGIELAKGDAGADRDAADLWIAVPVPADTPDATSDVASIGDTLGADYHPPALSGAFGETPVSHGLIADLAPMPAVYDVPALALAPVHGETALNLSTAERRRLQIRMRLLGFDPKGVDGIFGPKTRVAIMALQRAENVPASGYLTAELQELIKTRSRSAYIAWRKTLRRKAEQPRAEPVIAGRIPAARNAPQCARTPDGVIIDNQSFSCDVVVLQEGLRSLLRAIQS